jgi:hypothetical protein
MRIRSRPLMEASSLIQCGTPNNGSVNFITQVMVSNRTILTPMASISPILRVRALISTGKRFETIEMKMMLSIPKTTSKKVRVSKASHVSGFRKISMRGVYGVVWWLKIAEVKLSSKGDQRNKTGVFWRETWVKITGNLRRKSRISEGIEGNIISCYSIS